MEGYKSTTGKQLLNILMFSMYPEPKIIYREYIQNALDSIYSATKKGVLNKVKDGNVTVSINQKDRDVRIEDNGQGIPADDVAMRLLNIADSPKDGISAAGQFGIGRLVGAGYCRKLIFETSAKGEAIKTRLVLDVDFIEQVLQDSNDDSSANELMDAATTLTPLEENIDEHYFKVYLEDIKPDYDQLLDETLITDYLREVAPIDFALPFKSRYYNAIEERYKSYSTGLSYVNISVNKQSDIRKRYGLKIEGTEDSIEDLECFIIDDPKYGELAWGWFAITKFSKAIPASDENRGIRLRKHNIQIGDQTVLNKYFSEARGNNYFYGEVHILHDQIKPDSGRSGLAPTPESLRFLDLLKVKFIELKKLYNIANEAKNAVKNIIDLTSKAESGDYSEGETQTISNNIKPATAKFEKIETKAEELSSTQKVVGLYKKELEEKQNTKPKDNSKGNSTKNEDPPAPPQPKPSVKPVDIFAPLDGAMTPKEIFLVRRVFKAFTDHCPEGNKKLIEELKIMVVKELAKK
ncbi:MAG: ATP-binding protein [Bacteroidales bacterium]|nr:ATP-binding protein [Bacteroidales bacterium]